MKKGKAVLLFGGDILDYISVSRRISADDYIICADSGADHCERLDVSADLVIGDFDSVKSRISPEIKKIVLPREKNFTDSFHAALMAETEGYEEILIAGALGGRRFDHTLGNLQILSYLTHKKIAACITDGRTDIYAVSEGEMVLKKRDNHYFSVISLTQTSIDVSITGGYYPLENFTLTFDAPRGMSNEFTDGDVKISVGKGTLAVIVTPK